MRERHGGTGTKTYRAWMKMRERCNNANAPQYPRYGGRGIVVCPRWDSYTHFLSDMGESPVNTSLERIDNDGNYEPLNCRWASHYEQVRNRCTNHLITIAEETLCVADWATKVGLNRTTIDNRIRVLKWDDIDAITKPLRGHAQTSNQRAICLAVIASEGEK